MIKIWIIWIILAALIYPASADNLALLSGTLRTFQQAGCDDDIVSLTCPPGTSISVEVAQYGKAPPNKHLCPQTSTLKDVVQDNMDGSNISCLLQTALQYSLLQTVVEACQKKSNCKFQPSPQTYDGDPCPGERKFVEVAYKCRPYEFRSRVACENQRIILQCNPNSRIAIYSASYGRTEYESFQCPQPQGVAEETCLVSYATETVMQICHGKRSCELLADASTFGNPCRPQTQMYLRVVYTCVPRKVLNALYEGRPEEDEIEPVVSWNYNQDDTDSNDSNKDYIREFAALPPVTTVGNGSGKSVNVSQRNLTTLKFPPHTESIDLSEDNQETFYFYLILSALSGTGAIFCLIVIVGRLLLQRYRRKQDAKFHATNISDDTIPNEFIDDICDVDADINLTTQLQVPTVAVHLTTPISSSVEVRRYPYAHTNMHTLTKKCDNHISSNLNLPSNAAYYYG